MYLDVPSDRKKIQSQKKWTVYIYIIRIWAKSSPDSSTWVIEGDACASGNHTPGDPSNWHHIWQNTVLFLFCFFRILEFFKHAYFRRCYILQNKKKIVSSHKCAKSNEKKGFKQTPLNLESILSLLWPLMQLISLLLHLPNLSLLNFFLFCLPFTLTASPLSYLTSSPPPSRAPPTCKKVGSQGQKRSRGAGGGDIRKMLNSHR